MYLCYVQGRLFIFSTSTFAFGQGENTEQRTRCSVRRVWCRRGVPQQFRADDDRQQLLLMWHTARRGGRDDGARACWGQCPEGKGVFPSPTLQKKRKKKRVTPRSPHPLAYKW